MDKSENASEKATKDEKVRERAMINEGEGKSSIELSENIAI